MHNYHPYPSLPSRSAESAADRHRQRVSVEIDLQTAFKRTASTQALRSALRRTIYRS